MYMYHSGLNICISPHYHKAEAMASGALVIANHMVDPAPGIQNGVNLVLYNNTEQMMQLLHWYLDHPAAANRIAASDIYVF